MGTNVTGDQIKDGTIRNADVAADAAIAITKLDNTVASKSYVDTAVAGAVGPTGPTGPAGAQGPAGSNGTTGAQGAAGPTGPTGPAGAQGVAGTNGTNGAAGATGPTGPTGPAGTNGAAGATGAAGTDATSPVGAVQMYAGLTAPSGWLFCDGTNSYDRTTYASLFAVLYPSRGNPTISIASPAVVTLTAHGLVNGDRIFLETTGALPTGLSVRSNYFVVGATANTYQLSATLGGAAINTSGTQSGTHSAYLSIYTLPASGTTFCVPDLRGRGPIGAGAGTGLTARALGTTGGAETHTLQTTEIPAHNHADSGHSHGVGTFATANESAHTHATINSTYSSFVVSSNSGLSGANVAPVATGSNSWGYTPNTAAGTAHNHTITGTSQSSSASIGNTGGGGSHNNMQPWICLQFIIKT